MVGPVEESALLVPFVLPIETDNRSTLDRDPWREVDVVSDQDGFDGGREVVDLDNEALMSIAVVVIWEGLDHSCVEEDNFTAPLCVCEFDQFMLAFRDPSA